MHRLPSSVFLLAILFLGVSADDRSNRTVKSRLTILAGTSRSPLTRLINFPTPVAWSNATVFFKLSDNMTDSNKVAILSVINTLRNSTCLRFTPRQEEKNYTMFSMGPGCASMVGMEGGKQTVFLTDACFTPSRISRQIMHLLGLHSELNRPDRDQYVEINWRNIRPGFLRSFVRYPQSIYLAPADVPFDYDSVSHFDGVKFAVDSTAWTVRSKEEPTRTLGSARGFSPLDIKKINQIYCHKIA